MDEILRLLKRNALESPANLAKMLSIPESEVKTRIAEYEKSGVIRGYQAIVNEDRLELDRVQAVIEIKITPEREGGFDRIAHRISKFPEVVSLFLMSGGYDLLAFVRGRNLKETAYFVSDKLATIAGVVSTSTHFMLKKYKDQDVLMTSEEDHDRPKVSA
jgi:DNA-binding Lrp family transcriptional regulator